jgi:hypothetical protein
VVISAHCPVCEREGRDPLHQVTTTDEPVGSTGTARRWQLVVHPDGRGGICPGSGTRV